MICDMDEIRSARHCWTEPADGAHAGSIVILQDRNRIIHVVVCHKASHIQKKPNIMFFSLSLSMLFQFNKRVFIYFLIRC